MAETRQVLYVDSIITALQKFMAEQNHLFQTDGMEYLNTALPAKSIIFDVLLAAGLPADGIRMVIGSDEMDEIDDEHYHDLECAYCGTPAEHLVQSKSGYRLACERHAVR